MGDAMSVTVTVGGVQYAATVGPMMDGPLGVSGTVHLFRGAEDLGFAILYQIIMGGGEGWAVGDQDSDELTDDVLDALGAAITDSLTTGGM